MLTFLQFRPSALLAVCLLLSSGCCCDQWCHLPDDCAHAFNGTPLGCELRDVGCCELDSCCDCCLESECVCGDTCCIDDHCRRSCVQPGPPPVRYQPPMPPKFLPVPARSVFTNVNLNAPTLQAGQIEMGYGPEISFPAGD